MSNLRDGTRVSYIGDGATGRVLGDHGQVLYITGSSGHVKWASGDITLEDLHDISALGSVTRPTVAVHQPLDDLADSLDVGPIQSTGVRAAYDTEGEVGVINMLASSGQLGDFPTIAQDTLRFVESRVRQDQALRSAVASLDPDEADQVFLTAAHSLLRDAFGSGDVR